MSGEPLTVENLRQIHESSLRVLKQVGVSMPQDTSSRAHTL